MQSLSFVPVNALFLIGMLSRMDRDSLIHTYAYAADQPVWGDFPSVEDFLASLEPGTAETEKALGELFSPVGQEQECAKKTKGLAECPDCDIRQSWKD